MKRRRFLESSALATVALPFVGLTSCDRKNSGVEAPKNPVNAVDDFVLNEDSIDTLSEKMQSGEYTARGLAELYIRRIEDIDRDAFKLNSVIELNPDALTIAEQLDKERKNGKVRGPLHGIPFLLKDNIDTYDKMVTSAGSLALSGNYPRHDAPIVSQLRAAGAVLLGKTNLSEWANFRSSRSSSGWSSRGGQTKNPYSLERNPCGSSSGSGVAVAANLCSFAIGTETNGSINCPASVNGIVGFKPTVGLLSRSGIIPISRTQDTAGPMTRSVRDAAIVLGAMTSIDETDDATMKRPAQIPSDYTRFLDEGSLNGTRIGVERSFLKVHEKVDALLARAIGQMKSLGAVIVEVDYRKRLKPAEDHEYLLLQYEFKDGLNRYLQGTDNAVRSLKDVIAFNKEHANTAMPYFLQETLEASESRGGLTAEDYKKALDVVVNTSRSAIDETMKEHNLNALCGPASGPAWCSDLVNGDSFSGYGMGSGAAMAGYPSITVPMGEVHGLPVGLLFMATAYAEPDLFAIGYAYEQTSRNRTPPAFKKTML